MGDSGSLVLSNEAVVVNIVQNYENINFIGLEKRLRMWIRGTY